MKPLATLLLLLSLTLCSLAQEVWVDTLFIPCRSRFTEVEFEQLRFPIIKTGNANIDNLINADIKNRYTNNDFVGLPTDSTIITWADSAITYLDFTVTYKQNGLISFNISAEGCGAYCSGWTEYYTYNYKTGKLVTIDQIIDTSGAFSKQVIADRAIQYAQQIEDLKGNFVNDDNTFDQESYDLVLEYYKNCAESYNLQTFALNDTYIEFIDNCYLPHAMLAHIPTINLKYNYSDIIKELKLANLKMQK